MSFFFLFHPKLIYIIYIIFFSISYTHSLTQSHIINIIGTQLSFNFQNKLNYSIKKQIKQKKQTIHPHIIYRRRKKIPCFSILIQHCFFSRKKTNKNLSFLYFASINQKMFPFVCIDGEIHSFFFCFI